MVRSDTVFETVGTPRIFSNIATEGGDLLAGRVRLVDEAFFQHLGLQIQRNHPGFNGSCAVGNINLENPVHPRKMDDNTPFDGNCPTRQIGGGSAAQNRNLLPKG